MNDERSICESYIQKVLPTTLNEMAPPVELGGGSFDPGKIARGERGAPRERDYLEKQVPGQGYNIPDEAMQNTIIQIIVGLTRQQLEALDNKTFPGTLNDFESKILVPIVAATMKRIGISGDAKTGPPVYLARTLRAFMERNNIIVVTGERSRGGRTGAVKVVNTAALADLAKEAGFDL
jgi:hypothetical protein